MDFILRVIENKNNQRNYMTIFAHICMFYKDLKVNTGIVLRGKGRDVEQLGGYSEIHTRDDEG